MYLCAGENSLANKLSKQSGTILISTLLLLAVVTIIAVSMAERQRIDIKRTAKLLASSQAEIYVKPAEIWAITHLKKNPLGKTWPHEMPTFIIPEGAVNAVLYDAEGQFYNLNNVSELSSRQGFVHLLKLLLPDQSTENNKLLINAIVSWIQPLGKETDILSDQYYLNATPPYQSAHRFFVSPSELRLVKGVSQSIYSSLSPVMIALPEITKININTASPLLLTSLGKGLSIEEANSIVAKRNEKGGFNNVSDFFAIPAVQNQQLSASEVSLESNYFLLKTTVQLNTQTLTFFSLFKIKKLSPSTNSVDLLWQTRETL